MAEKAAASGNATEHTEQKYQSLKELSPQSAHIGTWLVTVAEVPRVWEYEYRFNGKQFKGCIR